MEWFQTIFNLDLVSFLSVLMPTVIILVGFGIVAYRAHLKHLRRIAEIKQGIYCIDRNERV